MDISRVPRSSLLGRALRAPLSLVPKDAIVPILQGPLRGKRWVVGAATHGCWLGTYEYRKQRLFARSIRPGAVVYDVGANVGFYTLLAAVSAGTNGRVYAFEPLPRNVVYLHRHLRLNQVQTVDIREVAVSDTAGWATFEDGASPSMGRLEPKGTLQVATVSLDELVFAHGLPASDVIKMDIEGGELRALNGARRLLEARHPLLFLSTHGNVIDEQCRALLTGLGYRLTRVDDEEVRDELVARFPA